MPSWDADLYRRFADERLQPALDLAARVRLESPERVVDLGCGPASSTKVLARHWPRASLTGVDSSTEMLAAARLEHPDWNWVAADIAEWKADIPFELVFSNAALQWVPNHESEFPRLLEQVAAGGAFAVQMPANFEAPPHALMRALAAQPEWRGLFLSAPREWHVHPPEFYYDVLAQKTSWLDIWTTEYVHVLESVDHIVEWYRGTGLRPFLDALPADDSRERFLAEYRGLLSHEFVPRPDGRILFPFRRLFVVAYR
jgi:trans-aconitate 2-methyltransferase